MRPCTPAHHFESFKPFSVHYINCFYIVPSFSIVPEPSLSLQAIPAPLPIVVVGHNISLLCEMTTPIAVDVVLPVSAAWRWEQRELPMWNRTQLLPIKQVSNQTYQSELILSEVMKEWEGLFECTFTLGEEVEEEEEEYENKGLTILPSSSSTTINLVVKGESVTAHEVMWLQLTSQFLCSLKTLELPNYNISVVAMGTEVAGTSLTLNCTVIATDPLLVAPLVQWVGPGGGVILDHPPEEGLSYKEGSAYVTQPHTEGNRTSLSLQFSSLRTSHTGRYTCRASSTLPHLTVQETVAMETLVVKCMHIIINIWGYTDYNRMHNNWPNKKH